MYEIDGGWIPIPRAIQDTIVWKNEKLWRFWTWCFFQAAYAQGVTAVGYIEVALKPGQAIITHKSAATETGLTAAEVRTCIKRLSSGVDPFISVIADKTTQGKTLITLLKYTPYSNGENQNDTAATQQPHSTNTATTQHQHGDNTAVTQHQHSDDTATTQLDAENSDAVSSLSPHARAPARLKEEEVKNSLSSGRPDVPEQLLEYGRVVLGLTCDFLLGDWVKQWDPDWIFKALTICDAGEKRGCDAISYAQGILRKWVKNGGPNNDSAGFAEGNQRQAKASMEAGAAKYSRNCGSASKSRSQRFGQYSYAEILEARERGRNSTSGVGELFDGFHWGAG